MEPYQHVNVDFHGSYVHSLFGDTPIIITCFFAFQARTIRYLIVFAQVYCAGSRPFQR